MNATELSDAIWDLSNKLENESIDLAEHGHNSNNQPIAVAKRLLTIADQLNDLGRRALSDT